MTDRPWPFAASDANLIARARLGDDLAFEALARRHRAALTDLAGLLDDRPGPLVDQALGVARRTLRRIQGPQTWMRGYLLQLTCRLHAQHASLRLGGASGLDKPDHLVASGLDKLDHPGVATQFSTLADAWQAAVWHRAAERETITEVAAVVGVSRDKVGALVGSARAQLRRSLLAGRWDQELPAPCRAHTRRLMDARPAAPPRSVLRHAARCVGCAAFVADLDAVQEELPRVVARHLLGDAGEAYLAVRRQAAQERLSTC